MRRKINKCAFVIPELKSLENRIALSTVVIDTTGQDANLFSINNDDGDPRSFYGTKFSSKIENGIAVFYLAGNLDVKSGDTVVGVGGKPISIRVSNNVTIPRDAIFQMSGGLSEAGQGKGVPNGKNNGGLGGGGAEIFDNGGAGGVGQSVNADGPSEQISGIPDVLRAFVIRSNGQRNSGGTPLVGGVGGSGLDGSFGVNGNGGFQNLTGFGLGGGVTNSTNNGGQNGQGLLGFTGNSGNGGTNLVSGDVLVGGGSGGSGGGGQGGGQGGQGLGGVGGAGGIRGNNSLYVFRITGGGGVGLVYDSHFGGRGGDGGKGGIGGFGGSGGSGGVGGKGGDGGGALEIRALGKISVNGNFLALGQNGDPGAFGSTGNIGGSGSSGLSPPGLGQAGGPGLGDGFSNTPGEIGSPGGSGQLGYSGGQGGKGGAGGGGAGGTIKLVATALDVGSGVINTSGGKAGDNLPEGQGGNGRFVFGDNVASTFGGKVIGATSIKTLGSREANPFSSTGEPTPFIPNLPTGAEIYGLTQLNPSHFESLGALPANSGPALLRMQSGPGIFSTSFANFDYLFLINKTNTIIQAPKIGFGVENYLKPLLNRGAALNPTFGGKGEQLLANLAPNAVYVTLVPRATKSFSASLVASGITTNTTTSSLEYNKPLALKMAPVITSGSSGGLVGGQAGKFQLNAIGSPGITFSIKPKSVPKGLTFDETSGVISTTKETPVGTYNFVVSAKNALGKSSEQNVSVVVGIVPEFSNVNKGLVVGGQKGTFQFQSIGNPKPTFSLQHSGLIDSGISLDEKTGLLTIGSKAPVGTYRFSVTSENGIGKPATQNFVLTVAQVPVVTSLSTASFLAGTSVSFQFTATGLPAPTFSIPAKNLPNGISLDGVTGKLSVIPGVPPGIYQLPITATNGIGTPGKQIFSLVLGQIPVFTNTMKASFVTGKTGTFALKATGIPTPTFGAIIPSNIGSIDPKTGLISIKSGAPVGVYSFDILATNSLGQTKKPFQLTIGSIPSIISKAGAGLVQGVGGSFSVNATGFPASKFSISGKGAVAGISINPDTGILTVAPSLSLGTYSLVIQASNEFGKVQQNFSLIIGLAPEFKGPTVVQFRVGLKSSFTVTATGTPKPSFVISQDNLNLLKSIGLSFNGLTGILTGTTKAGKAGTYKIPIVASNGLGQDKVQTFTFAVS